MFGEPGTRTVVTLAAALTLTLQIVILLLPAEICHAQADKMWLDHTQSYLAGEEKRHFLRLPGVRLDELEPGDILLKKDYGDYRQTSPVIRAQYLFRAKRASRYTSHAILFTGAGAASGVAEAIADAPSGVWNRRLDTRYGPPPPGGTGPAPYPQGAHILVYRCTDAGAIQRALQCAALFATDGWGVGAGSKPLIGYSMKNCMGAFFGSSRNFGPKARANATAVTNRRAPFDAMMCSEFVTFCFQNGYPAVGPTIELDAHRTAPIRLEETLNHNDQFDFLGRLEW